MANTLSPRSLVAQRFVIESEAGSGGMGTVYRALDTVTGRTVALKLMHGNPGDDETARFKREAQLLAELDHPGIVAHIASGQTEHNRPFIAMSWLDGEDLAQRLRKNPLTTTETMQLLRGVARPLSAAHRRGIVHRDLKPSNIFLANGDVGQVVLLDFGIARRTAMSHVLTGSGVILGTADYMSPEQVRGQRDIGPSADIFALGCVAFECLTGQPPFVAQHLAAVLAKVLFDEPPDVRTIRSDVSDGLATLIAKMLHKAPDQRPRNAMELEALLESLEGLAHDDSSHALAPARGLGFGNEWQLVNVIIAASRTPIDETMQTLEPAQDDRILRLQPLRDELVAAGARVEMLSPGAFVMTLNRTDGAAAPGPRGGGAGLGRSAGAGRGALARARGSEHGRTRGAR